MTLEYCPKCNRKLGLPLKSSGRQVCVQCGWSDKPRQASTGLSNTSTNSSTNSSSSNSPTPPANAAPAKDLTPDEVQRLLNQAAADALLNMKPKSQKTTSTGKKKRFPFLGF